MFKYIKRKMCVNNLRAEAGGDNEKGKRVKQRKRTISQKLDGANAVKQR